MTRASQLSQVANTYSNRNLIINGAMQIAQKGTSATGITGGSATRSVDRFKTVISSLGTWTVEQSTDAPDGFSNSLKHSCTTANASPAAGDYLFIDTRLEGQQVQHLAKGTTSAKKVTLSFWVKCNKTGNMQVNLRDHDNARQISSVVSISSADTWEKKTITFDGDTTGAFDNDNNESLRIEWYLDSGTTYSSGSTPTAWETISNADRNAGGTLALGDSTSNYINITGVQLEVGETATEFEHRPYGMEQILCKRYYETIQIVSGWHYSWNLTQAYLPYTWLVEKRTTPTCGDTGNITWQYWSAGGSVNFTPTFTPQNVYGTQIRTGSISSGNGLHEGEFYADAEL